MFFKFKQQLLDRIAFPQTTDRQLRDIARDLRLVARQHYSLSSASVVVASGASTKDVAFEIARVFMRMADYSAALEFLAESERDCGRHHVTSYNRALCYHYLGHAPQALACFEECSLLKPDYAHAMEWLGKLKLDTVSVNSVTLASSR